MKNPLHPGVSVRLNCLEPFGLSVTEGAKALGVSRITPSRLINRQSGVPLTWPSVLPRLSELRPTFGAERSCGIGQRATHGGRTAADVRSAGSGCGVQRGAELVLIRLLSGGSGTKRSTLPHGGPAGEADGGVAGRVRVRGRVPIVRGAGGRDRGAGEGGGSADRAGDAGQLGSTVLLQSTASGNSRRQRRFNGFVATIHRRIPVMVLQESGRSRLGRWGYTLLDACSAARYSAV